MSSYLHDIDRTNVPAHVAIVMDGNGRWATQRGLPRTEGHGAGIGSGGGDSGSGDGTR